MTMATIVKHAEAVVAATTPRKMKNARARLDHDARLVRWEDRWCAMHAIASASTASDADCVRLNALVTATAEKERVSRDSVLERLAD